MNRTKVAAIPKESAPITIEETEQGIFAFSVPDHPTREELNIIPEIVRLDHRAKHQLGVNTKMWIEVHWLIYNTLTCLSRRDIKGTKYLLQIAQDTYNKHNQSRNRMWYLAGTLAGIFAASALGSLLFVSGVVSSVGTHLLLMTIMIFAGLGSTASVLIRLNDIDLAQETSRFLVFISGSSKPLIAIVFAIVVFFILKLKIVAISIGNSPDENSLYAVTSFLCGFSERFATDIISQANMTRPPGPKG